MAQLKDLIVNGASRLIGDVFTNKIQITAISAPTVSNGTTYGPGTSGQVLKSNGTSVYWAADDNSQTVTGVKGNSESSYRTGNVNITAANIGLGNVENTKLSTWAGSENITTLGTISSGTVPWARLSGVPAGASKEGTVTSITLKAGTGISLDTDNTAITSSGTRTISHADTSSQASVTANGRKYITGVTLDTYGHVTGLTTGTETVTDTHHTAYLRAGASGGTENAATTTGNTYLNLVENSTNRSGVKLVPGSNMAITSDASGNVTFAATNTTYSAGTGLSLSGTTFKVQNVPEAELAWGGKNFSASYGPIDAAMIEPLGANRFAFLNAAGLTIEYSTNGGSTWTDYGATDVQKTGLFGAGQSFVLGKHSTAGTNTVNDQLRVTIATSAAGIYTTLNKIAIYMSTSGNTVQVKMEKALESTPTSFSTHLDWTDISGWSGWNILNISGITTYGNSAASQYGRIRFIFRQTAVNTNYASANISRIMGFGGMGWTVPSNMARDGHLYGYDNAQNATFPAQITATAFNGNAASSTYASNIRITDTTPTSATYYPLVFATGVTSGTNYVARGNQTLRVWLPANGSGTSFFVAGNTSTNGGLCLYSSSGKYVNIITSAMSSENRTLTIPDVTATIFTTAGGTCTGNISVSKSAPSINVYDTANNNISVQLSVGSGHQNHGVYSNGYAPTASTFTSSAKWIIYRGSDGEAHSQLKIYGAVFNDYAEYRTTKNYIEPGRCIIETGNDDLILSTTRLQPGAEIVSDTFGFAIGQTKESNTPIASNGRVLAYIYEGREAAKNAIGKPVCSGPNGTVSIMTDEEYQKYGYCAIGTISSVPSYETWGTDNIKVNGRIWIRIK